MQRASLETWRSQAVARAVGKVQEAMNAVTAAAPGATLWAWDGKLDSLSRDKLLLTRRTLAASRAAGSSDALVPSSPSSALLSALRSLSSSVLRVGLHRTQSDPSIAFSLLDKFAEQARSVADTFGDVLDKGEVQDDRVKREIAAQVAWDLSIVGEVLSAHKGADGRGPEWETVKTRFLRIVRTSSFARAARP